jgi:trehalose 6-phosphate phosphatase
MRNLLIEPELEVLAQLAWSKALLAFDFDGTLAPIVRDRDAAGMSARTARLFDRACQLYPMAVISGRSRADVAGRLGASRVKYVVGNHGLEPGDGAPGAAAELDEARARLARLVARSQGIDLEDKRYSLAVHYRRSRTRREALRAIVRLVGRLETPVRVVTGKCVINLVPASAPSKGDALLALRRRARADVALYVGDDVTDEDVFRLDQPGRLVSVRVGRSGASAAPFFVRDQAAVDAMLEKLIAFREKPPR